jgi:NAD-dependent deacetylase
LTGAGVSAESGLGTFRGPDGLWDRVDVAKLASIVGYIRDPSAVHAFYNARRAHLPAAQPNPAHVALAQLEQVLTDRGEEVFLCTQNVDDLHERAGSRSVLHMHGELAKGRCEGAEGGGCGVVLPWPKSMDIDTICPQCEAMGTMRPHVVWFGEIPFGLDLIAEKLEAATQFVAIGTSGAVYPAAGLVDVARSRGVPTLELNLAPSDTASVFDAARYGPAGEVVPAWVADVLG